MSKFLSIRRPSKKLTAAIKPSNHRGSMVSENAHNLPLTLKQIYRLKTSWREVRINLRDAVGELMFQYVLLLYKI